MSSRQLFSFIVSPVKTVLFLLFMTINVSANASSEQILLSNQVQQLLKINNEMLHSDTVKNLLEKITNNQQHYSNDVVAKIFLLSAKVASNQGDINNVLLYSEKGLAANSLDKTIRLSLLLKLAEVYVVKEEYKRLLDLTQLLVKESSLNLNAKYNLLSLSYRSVAFTMLGKHQQALEDLQKVEQGISKSALTEHIELLNILALAYYQLSDYQTSLSMQLKILKLRFEMDQKMNIDQTYLYLGYAYFYLERFDDAYTAFWEAKKAAESKKAPINIAYAEKGLGIVLLKQKYFEKSRPHLEQASKIFYQHNMLSNRIESSVILAKVKLEINEKEEAYVLLIEVVKLLKGTDISHEYSGFYRMLAEMYFEQKDYRLAYRWLMKHSQVLLEKFKSNKKASNIVNSVSHLTIGGMAQHEPIEESKKIAVRLAENSKLSSSFIDKYQNQRVIIISLSSVVLILLLLVFGLLIRFRAQKINKAYEEAEKPSYSMTGPMKTKLHYQSSFKKARRFQYPLSVGYLLIDNWEELLFHFNSKTINEVMKDIANVINQQIAEFDYAGLLNEGEYLLLFEHQNKQEVDENLSKLVQTINARSFANLGNFSVTMKYSLNTPGFKDIDPYLFLARIAESVNVEPVNQSKGP